MLVTDEMVATAAREGCGHMAIPDGALTPDGRVYYSGFRLRDALEAVAPAIRAAALEEAAKVVEPGNWPEYKAMGSTLAVAAAAIRALKDKEPT